MRTYGCDACGNTVELAGSANRDPDGWATARLVQRGHTPENFMLCPSCTADTRHLLTAARRGQTRLRS